MNYNLTRLKNGLRVLSVPMPSLESATVTVWIKTGSRNEGKEVLGLSHFLEHMAFKGGKKYKSARKVSETIDGIGGEFNASTSKEYTNFYVRARQKLLATAYDVLADIVLYPSLKEEDIRREKGVIIEEMNMNEDTPIRKIWDEFEEIMFEGHPLESDTIGKKETVLSLSRDDFVGYRNKYYFATNMLVTVAGGVKAQDVFKLTEEFFGKLPKVGSGKTVIKKPENDKVKVRLTSKKIEQAHILVGFPGDPLGDEARYEDATMDILLGEGMSSRLWTEVREKRGLAYAVRSEFERYLDGGYFAAYAGVDPGKGEEVIKVILDQFYGLTEKKYPLDKYELSKAKEYLKGHLALSLEDTRGVNSFYGFEKLMLAKIRTPKEVYEKVDKVSEEDIYSRAKRLFDPKKVKLTIIGPYTSQASFEKLLA